MKKTLNIIRALVIIALFILCCRISIYSQSDTLVGPRGGKYTLNATTGEKEYVRKSRLTDLGNGKAHDRVTNKDYDIETGPQGGRFCRIDGEKVYGLPRKQE